MNLLTESWISLAIAIMFGVMGTISLKLSHSLHRIKLSLLALVFYTVSFIALTLAMKHIQLSVVYAVWSGAGTVLVALIGVAYFHESLSVRKILYLLLIVAGVIGMHLSNGVI